MKDFVVGFFQGVGWGLALVLGIVLILLLLFA